VLIVRTNGSAATYRAAIQERLNVHGPLTAQAQKYMQHADRRDAHQARLVILVDPVNEDPAVDPRKLRY